MEPDDKRYEISVQGRVQGVGFRYAANREARNLGLKGWVENRIDGSVFILIQGSQEKCNRFIGWCRKGPAYSWVERIDFTEKPTGRLTKFRVVH